MNWQYTGSLFVTTYTENVAGFDAGRLFSSLGNNLGFSLINLGKAILVLLVGLLIAHIVRKIIARILQPTKVDPTIAEIMEEESGAKSLAVESWIAQAAYWLILLLTLVGFFQTLKLESVAKPINNLLEQIFEFLPRLGSAALFLGGVWAIASLVKLLIKGAAKNLKLDERLGEEVNGNTGNNKLYFSDTLSNAGYWFIFLVFLPAVLNTLNLKGTLKPVQALLNEILSALPNILAAVLIGVVGWVVAGIIRRIVRNLLTSLGIDAVGAKVGITKSKTQSLSAILANLAYILVLIPIAIAAFEALKIEAISLPATQMLTQVLTYLPKLLVASIILGMGYFVGKYAAQFIADTLTGLGFNSILKKLGFARSTDVSVVVEQSALSPHQAENTRSPAEIVGVITSAVIILIATIAAVDILELAALSTLLQSILVVTGQVIFALIVFTIGLWLANLTFKLISSSNNRQARLLAHTARIGIISFTSAMALEQIGLATSIINLAFGLLLGAIATALAIAFGLGGTDLAAREIQSRRASLKENIK